MKPKAEVLRVNGVVLANAFQLLSRRNRVTFLKAQGRLALGFESFTVHNILRAHATYSSAAQCDQTSKLNCLPCQRKAKSII
jgi:hypothetical protein